MLKTSWFSIAAEEHVKVGQDYKPTFLFSLLEV